MTKVKFNEIASGSIFWFKGTKMKKNKHNTAIIVDESDRHLAWTSMGVNDECMVREDNDGLFRQDI